MIAPFHSRAARRALALLGAAGAFASASAASAANPVLRHQEDLHGDVVVFGSTLGFDCGSGVAAPAGSSASCVSQVNVADSAPDLYWRDGVANASITPTSARTSATLVLPPGASITYARLYWAALKTGNAPDTNATLDWLNGPQQVITADQTWVVPYGFPSHPDYYYYQASGDATDFVATWGAGDFRVSDVEALAFVGLDVDRAFSAWTLVVFYDNPGDELRNLALFDSFLPIDPGMMGQQSASVTLKGFLVPEGFKAKMTALAYEGDKAFTGDHFTINGAQLGDALNPADNFFNSSRSELGQPVSGAVDVPKLSGAPGSMAGYDLDTVDVTSHLAPGDTQCTVGADSTLDIFFLGGFATSVISLAPDFKGMAKDVVDLDGGAVLAGDKLRYTITAVNGGNDAAVDAVLTDLVDPGLALVPGSIEILQGGVIGKKTDAPGDDQADYDPASRQITVRVGAGATAASGGTVGVGETVQVRFDVTVAVMTGTVANQALLTGSGLGGAPEKTWLSDGDPKAIGDQPTVTAIHECDSDAQCKGDEPHCDPVTKTCAGCASDADCKDPKNPACQPSGACGECSTSNDALCVGATPVCDTMNGICVLCTLGPSGDATKCMGDPAGPICVAGPSKTVHCGCLKDLDCGGAMSGTVCDLLTEVCVPGCKGDGNGCPVGMECSSKDSTIGQCVPATQGAGGAGGAGTGAGTGAETGAGTGTGGGDLQGDKGSCACAVPGVPARDAGGLAAALGVIGIALARRRARRG